MWPKLLWFIARRTSFPSLPHTTITTTRYTSYTFSHPNNKYERDDRHHEESHEAENYTLCCSSLSDCLHIANDANKRHLFSDCFYRERMSVYASKMILRQSVRTSSKYTTPRSAGCASLTPWSLHQLMMGTSIWLSLKMVRTSRYRYTCSF